MEESSQETHETSVSTEIYDDESLKVEEDSKEDKFIEKPQVEIASRIIWTTPKTITTETRKTIIKDIITAAMEVIPSQESSTKDWDIEISEYEKNSTQLSTTTDSYDESGDFNKYFKMFDTLNISTLLLNRLENKSVIVY